MGRPPYYVKTLRLVPPDVANQLGIPAEAPTFLSPLVRGAQACSVPTCDVVYTPLMYATGRVSAASHYHRNCGGVYFYVVTDSLDFLDALLDHAGWLAGLEPRGTTMIDPPGRDYGTGRAEAVLVKAISAWCMNRELDGHEYLGRPHGRHLVEEGLLYHYPGSRQNRDLLLPVCDRGEIDVEYAPLRFMVRDGQVFFTQRDQP
jgi:hypothetical protein